MKRSLIPLIALASLGSLTASAAQRQYDLNLQGRIIGANASLHQGLKLLNLKTELRRAHQISQQQLTRMKVLSVSVNAVAVGPVQGSLSLIAGENESAPAALPTQQSGSSFLVQLNHTPSPQPVGADPEAWLLRSTTQARVYGITLIVDDAVGGPVPVPPNPFPNPGPIPPNHSYEAECHIDDDTTLNYDQIVIPIRSSSLQGLISDCNSLAVARAGTNSSAGLRGIRSTAPVLSNQMTAVCHIDDDPTYNADQFVVGTLFGSTVQEMMNDCRAIATMAFRNQGSSGLEGLKIAGSVLPGSVTATCEIDDDPDFNPDQFHGGVIVGRTVQELIQTCQQIAVARYGTQGSSGIKDVKYY